jgi:DNA-binding phage protein
MAERKEVLDALRQTIPVGDADALLHEHMVDLRAAVLDRLEELRMPQYELARRMGVDPGSLSRVLRTDGSLTLRTVARLEAALGIDLCAGFRHPFRM